MARKQVCDGEPAELSQGADQGIEAAVIDVLEENLATEEDHIAGEQVAAACGPSRMIAMTMSEDQMADPRRVESILLDVGDDRLGPHPRADVDEGQLVASVHQVDVAVEGVREVETIAARTDQIDPFR